MADGVWKGVYPLVFGRSKQHLLNKFFDLSTPFMRIGGDGGKTEKKGGRNGGIKIKLLLILTNDRYPLMWSWHGY